jgi:hypothetical protein
VKGFRNPQVRPNLRTKLAYKKSVIVGAHNNYREISTTMSISCRRVIIYCEKANVYCAGWVNFLLTTTTTYIGSEYYWLFPVSKYRATRLYGFLRSVNCRAVQAYSSLARREDPSLCARSPFPD